jgi:hypothetical protein
MVFVRFAHIQDEQIIAAVQPCFELPRRNLRDMQVRRGRFFAVWSIIASLGGLAASFATASILAKVHRDRMCLDLHRCHPQYGFDAHKGYATPEHLRALREHGVCEAHRRSFAPVRLAEQGVGDAG